MKKFCFIPLFVSLLFAETLFSQNNPPLTVVIHDSSATRGYIFAAPYLLIPPYVYDHPMMILDRFGNTVYYKAFFSGGIAATVADFTLQPNGLMSFFTPILARFYLMDSTFTVIDSVEAAGGFGTDTHELQILPNGHYLILGREMRVMNLTAWHWFGENHTLPGGPNAEVTGAVVQELDENKNLVFQWQAHDHFDFGDVDSVWLSSPTTVDWTHANAVEMDFDGNILLSCRHFNSITKINRQTGAIMWRFGGKKNQFVFANDPVGFTGQHDIRRIPNGHVTLWDNGQYTIPPVGRALEYSLDETAKIATLEWEYIYDSAMFSSAMGNHQLLSDGDRFITHGFIEPGFPMMVHVKPDKSRVLEIFGPEGYANYRSFNYDSLPFVIHRPSVQCQKISGTWYLVADPGYPEYLWSNGATTQSVAITVTGKYQVFVPYGQGGHAGSEVVAVSNLSNPCNMVSTESKEIGEKPALSCYPNPVHDVATIIITLPVAGKVSLSLIDLMGCETILESAVEKAAGRHALLVSRQNRSGMYMLKMKYEGGEILQKIIFRH